MPIPAERLFGRIAVARGFATQEQIHRALRRQEAESPPPPLGVVLVEEGVLTHEQVLTLLADQGAALEVLDPHTGRRREAWRLGDRALQRGLLTVEQLNRALREQARREEARGTGILLGEILVDQGVMSRDDLQRILAEQEGVVRVAGSPAPGGNRTAPAPTEAGHFPGGMKTPGAGGGPPVSTDRNPIPTVAGNGRQESADSAHFPPAAEGPGRAAGTTAPRSAPTEGEPTRPPDPPAAEGGVPAETVLLPEQVVPAAFSTGRRVGKYELVQELGRGGGGVVYKAYHSELRAHFALKVLLSGDYADDGERARFRLEAQAAARLRHPGIVRVHDLGIEEGRAYFVMEYIEGISLDKLIDGSPTKGWPVADAIRMVREAAEAIQAAHDEGVIHRDLKPANLIRDASGRVRVSDFGLAKIRDRSAPAAPATRSGTLMGTPQYMSPEQADGRVREVDERSDVYQLGAILYELLTGRPPYQGSSVMEVILRIAREDPPPPRVWNSRLPPEAEAICWKALAREKGRRYASARELAEDCARFLAGEEVRARPESRPQRVLRWARLRRWRVAGAAAVVVALLFAAGFAWQASADRRAREREREERSRLQSTLLRELQDKAGTLVAAALEMRRAGLPLDRAKNLLPRLQEAVTEADRALPDRPEPHHHLGRMYRALMRFPEALAEQRIALARDPGFVPARYEQAVLTARALGDRVDVLRREEDVAAWRRQSGNRTRADRDSDLAGRVDADPAARELRERLLIDLERLLERPDVPESGLDCLLGLRIVHGGGGDPDEARRRLAAAVDKDSGLEEAFEAWATLEENSGRRDRAIEILGRALEADRGYVPFWIRRGRLARSLVPYSDRSAQDIDALLAASRKDLDQALLLDPGSIDARSMRSVLHLEAARHALQTGRDPEPFHRDAESDLVTLLAAAPNDRNALQYLTALRIGMARQRADRGEDPGSALDAAGETADRTVALDERFAWGHVWRGQVHATRGDHAAAHGHDPVPSFREAEGAFSRALEIDPSLADAWAARGSVRGHWAAFAARRGKESDERFAAAEQDLDAALERTGDLAELWLQRGSIRAAWARSPAVAKRDPEPLYLRALADYERAHLLAPARADVWEQIGGVQLDRAGLAIRRSEDPNPLWEHSVRAFERAAELNPRLVQAWTWLGGIHYNRALYDLHHGRDPIPRFEAALGPYGRALELNPQAANVWAYRGMLRYKWAWVLRENATGDPVPQLTLAIDDLSRSLAINPGSADAWVARAMSHEEWARVLVRAGQDPIDRLRAAVSDLDSAIERVPKVWRAWMLRGDVRRQMAARMEARGERDEATRILAEGCADLEAAVRLAPGSGEARKMRGRAFHQRREWAAAANDFSEGLRLDPIDAGGETGRLLADARRREAARRIAAAAHARELGNGELARLELAEGIRWAEMPGAVLRPEDREAVLPDAVLHEARLALARLLTTASPPGDGSDPREEAFRLLHTVLKTGGRTRAQLEEDPALAPLREDPRWRLLPAQGE